MKGFPVLTALFYAEFHPIQGPVVVCSMPDNAITSGKADSRSANPASEDIILFDAISEYVIPKPSLCNRLVSVMATNTRVIVGHPVSIEDPKYERNAFLFNLVFVFEAHANFQPYEQIVRKMARFLRSLEVESGYLSSKDSKRSIIDLMEKVHEFPIRKECRIFINDFETLNLKLLLPKAPPPRVFDWQVPVQVYSLTGGNEKYWDMTISRVLKYINGALSVKRIAEVADVELGLVRLAVQHLLYYKCVQMVDIFQFSNIYSLEIRCLMDYLDDGNSQSELIEIVKKDVTMPSVSFTRLYTILCGMRKGVTVKEWAEEYDLMALNIDIRRLVVFGTLKGFLFRVHRYPVFCEGDSGEPAFPGLMDTVAENGQQNVDYGKLINYLNGRHHFDAGNICAVFGANIYERAEDSAYSEIKNGSLSICKNTAENGAPWTEVTNETSSNKHVSSLEKISFREENWRVQLKEKLPETVTVTDPANSNKATSTQPKPTLEPYLPNQPKLDSLAPTPEPGSPNLASRSLAKNKSAIEPSDGELRKRLKTSHPSNQGEFGADIVSSNSGQYSGQSDPSTDSAAFVVSHPTPAQSVSPDSPDPAKPFAQMSSTDEISQTAVPDHFHHAETAALTHMIADMLQRLTSHNDQIPLSSSTLTRFHSRAPPGISILDYLRRIVKYASVERVCLLILLVYIDRVCERNRSFTISSLTVHRFIITGVTVACKALCDSFLQNSMYAKVGGISTKELNVLEVEFLTLIGWDLTAGAERLQDYYRNLVRQHPGFRMVPHAEVVTAAILAETAATGRTNLGDWTGTSKYVEAAEFAENQVEQQRQMQEIQHQALLQQLQLEQHQQRELANQMQSKQHTQLLHQLDLQSAKVVAEIPTADASVPFYDGFSYLNSLESARRELDTRMNA
ncbi:Nitrogen permease regulator 2 [Chytriomyces hyalinus]|nr:Nitrogen permease regulator 2 [Chytriomyces hyalinus]